MSGVAFSIKSNWPLLAVDVLYLTLMICLLIGSYDYLSSTLAAGKMFAWVDGDRYSFSDFVHFYQCGQLTLSPDHERIYDPQMQLEWFNKLFTNFKWDKPHFIQYVPFVFPLCVPLALLPMAKAYVAWLILSLSCGAGSVILLARHYRRLSWGATLAILVGAASSWVSILSLRIGQPSWLLTAIVAIYFWGLFRKHDIASGIMLALASFKPHYALFFAVPAVALRRWALLATAAACEAVLLTLAGMTVGWQNVFGYPSILMHADATAGFLGVHVEKMVCVRGLLSGALPPEAVLPASLAVMLAALAGACVWWLRAAAKDEELTRWGCAVLVLMSLFFSPHTHFYDYLILAVSAVLTLDGPSAAAIAGRRPASFLLWSLLLFVYPAFTWASQTIPAVFPGHDLNPYLAADVYHFALLAAGVLSVRHLSRRASE